MTLYDARALCREFGCTLRSRDGEYRVNFLRGAEATAYYTNDLEDAVDTAMAMSLQRAAAFITNLPKTA